jgi:hypothetical protein
MQAAAHDQLEKVRNSSWRWRSKQRPVIPPGHDVERQQRSCG